MSCKKCILWVKQRKQKKVAQIACTGAVGELGQFVQCRKQNAPFRTIIFCPHSHLSGRIRQTWRMPWWSWLTSTSMRTTWTFHRWRTSVIINEMLTVNKHPVPQVCQIAARFQDEGDERQVKFSNSNFLSLQVNLSLSILFSLTRF